MGKNMNTKVEGKKEKKLSSMILLLFITVVMLGVTTYAWFTSNQLVKINSIDLSVQASEGFQISVDGVNWKSVINTAEILGATANYASHINHVPTSIVPVSTAAQQSDATTGLLDFYFGTTTTNNSSNYILYGEKITETTTTGQFIAFDLFFRTNNDMYLLLEPDSGVRDIATVLNRQNRGMENSSRIAFVNQGYIDGTTTPNPSAATVQALVSSETDGSNIRIWEPNYLSHTTESKTEAYNMYGIATSSSIYNAWIPYAGMIDDIAEASGILLPETNATDNPLLFADVEPANFIKTAKGFTTAELTDMVIKAGVTKYRIYMWIEGQDYDCSDSASGSDIRYDLVLSVQRVSP